MFELTMNRQELLTPLLTVANAVDKKQSMPILSNILLKLDRNTLFLTATDLEIEITSHLPCIAQQTHGEITVPAKKMIDIMRSLDENASPTLLFKDNIITIREGRSQFKLATLPAADYPQREETLHEIEFQINREALIHILQSTHFAMSQHDVRIFLNGLLLEIDHLRITAVATDGHRMAIAHTPCSITQPLHRLLIPRKAIQEMLRLLNNIPDAQVLLSANKYQIKLSTDQYVFASKLIDARFPPYIKAIPKNQDKQVTIDSELLKRALSRMVILAHEKSRAVLLHIEPNQLTLVTNNQEQDEATESLSAQTQGHELKIGVNANYLLDVLNHIPASSLRLSFSDEQGSILVESLLEENYQYIIMPMKL